MTSRTTPSELVPRITSNPNQLDAKTQKLLIKANLCARYACSASGHNFCSVDEFGEHKALNEGDIDSLTEVMYQCQADPYRYFTSLTNTSVSNSISDRSIQRSATLTGYSTFHSNLSQSSISSISSKFSGELGPGWLAGRFMEWSGSFVTRFCVRVEIVKRCYEIGRLCTKMETNKIRIKGQNRKDTKKVYRALNDLVELSRLKYATSTSDFACMASFRLWIHLRDHSPAGVIAAISSQRSHGTSVDSRLIEQLRKIMARDPLQADNAADIVKSVVEHVLRELCSYEPDDPCQWQGCQIALDFLTNDLAMDALRRVEDQYGLLTLFAKHIGNSPPKAENAYSDAMRFLFALSKKMKQLREYLIYPGCIPKFLDVLESLAMVEMFQEKYRVNEWWAILAEESETSWMVALLMESGIDKLLSDPRIFRVIDIAVVKPNASFEDQGIWTACSQIQVMRNICVHGGDENIGAVRTAGGDFECLLPHLLAIVAPSSQATTKANELVSEIRRRLAQLIDSTKTKLGTGDEKEQCIAMAPPETIINSHTDPVKKGRLRKVFGSVMRNVGNARRE